MREQPMHICVIYVAAAVNVTHPRIYWIPLRIIHMIQQQPHVHDVHDAVTIEIAAHRYQRQMIFVRATRDVVCRITEPIAVIIYANVIRPVVATDERSADYVWSCGSCGVPDVGFVIEGVVRIVNNSCCRLDWHLKHPGRCRTDCYSTQYCS